MTPLYGRALLEWPLLLAVLTVFGTVAFAQFVAPSGDAHGEMVVRALSPLWRALAVVAFLVSPLILLSLTAEMAAVSWREAMSLIPAVMTDTHVGRVWACFLPITVLLLAGVYRLQWRAVRIFGLLMVTMLLLFCEALSSHATDIGLTTVVVYFVHEVAAGLWIGALLGLWIVARRGKAPKGWVEAAAGRVSHLAAWCVLVVALTGAAMAYDALGLSFSHLLFSAYGRILLVKVVVFGIVLMLGAHNRYWLAPTIKTAMSREALLRNVGVESFMLLVGVLALALLLANTPPAAHNSSEYSTRVVHRGLHASVPYHDSSFFFVRAPVDAEIYAHRSGRGG